MSVTEMMRGWVIPILDSLGLELFDLSLKRAGRRHLLRIYIDKDGGVTLDDCQRASREIGAILDVKDPLPGSYQLEVSSPGINRLIRNEQEFQRYRGNTIKVKWTPSTANPKTLVGINRGVENQTLRLEVSSGEEVFIPLTEIVKAHLEVEL